MRTLIESRLAGTRPPDDPADVRIPGLPGDIPAHLRDRVRLTRLRPAAVLVALEERDDDLYLILTRRTDHLKDHPGQVSFPGGSIERGDDGPVGAALREAHEEIGLDPGRIEIAGFLPNYLTITGFAVTPVVGFVRGPVRYRLDPYEVAEAFEVPLGYVFDPANHRHEVTHRYGVDIPIYEINYGRHRIWGATAGMILGFYQLLQEHLNY